jgi:hypothetical protein
MMAPVESVELVDVLWTDMAALQGCSVLCVANHPASHHRCIGGYGGQIMSVANMMAGFEAPFSVTINWVHSGSTNQEQV